MRYSTYQKIKKVDIRWLDTLPAHWEVSRLKHVAHINSQTLNETTREDVTIQYVDIGNVTLQGLQNPPEELRFGDAPSRARRIVHAGDTIISTVRTYLQAIAYFENPPSNLIASTGFAVLTPTEQVFPKFLYYLVRAPRFINDVTAHSVGVGYPAVNPSDLANLPVWLPNLQEQQAIANFLDRETAVIDALIVKKRELIERLQEKRTALISHAVTKGLDPTVPMKESGVEWLGEIPAHWQNIRLKFKCDVKARLGWRGLKASEYVDDGFIFLSTPNIKGDEIDFVNVNYISEERYYESPEIILREGYVLLAKDGSTLGITNVVRNLPRPATVNSSIAVLKPDSDINSVFLYYYLSGSSIQNLISQQKDGMGVPHLFQSDIREFQLLIPPLYEQQAIAIYLDKEISTLNQLVNKVELAIERLQEYRTALISAAVTGKIEVRPHVRP